MNGALRIAVVLGCWLLLAGPCPASSGERAPGTAWSISVGDIKDEEAGGCLLRDDGMLLVCGSTRSYSTGDSDGLVVLLDPEDGDISWERPYGGIGDDFLTDLAPAPDGGFYAVGGSGSDSHGGEDIWVIRCDAGGNPIWQRRYGGEMDERAEAAVSDSGVVVAGMTWSQGSGGCDGCLLRLDAEGEVEWFRTFGGADMDRFFDVARTEGGYIATGTTYSQGEHGEVLTVWTGPAGMEESRMVWGGPDYDYGRAIMPREGGGAVVCCWSKRSVCNLALLFAADDGSLEREVVIPTGYSVRGEAILGTPDGCMLVAGTRETPGSSGMDLFLWRLDPRGERMWEGVAGGTGDEELTGIAVTSEGRPVLAATSTSTGRGDSDIWLVGLERMSWRGWLHDE